MTRKSIAPIVLVSAAVSGVGIAFAAHDKYTPRSPSGISFSEFRGYEAWQTIAVSQTDDGKRGCGTAPASGCIKAIVGNAKLVKAYEDGIPENGKPVPDGAAFAKIEWANASDEESPYDVTVPGTYAEVAFMLKDAKRFPKTNGWGYATFVYDAASDTFKAKGDGPDFVKACHSCHTIVKDRDYVFTRYAKR